MDTPIEATANAGMASAGDALGLGKRICALPLAKTLSTTGLTGLFLTGYIYVSRHPMFAVTTMPALPIDHWIGFHPQAVVVYLSLWLYLTLGVALMGRAAELVRFWTAAMSLACAGIVCFSLFPTAIPPAMATWGHSSLFAFLRDADECGNACPSLHTGFAVLLCAVIDSVLPRGGRASVLRLGNALWAAAIIWSTLAIKQHVVLDDIAGAVLGLGAVAIFRWVNVRRCLPRR